METRIPSLRVYSLAKTLLEDFTDEERRDFYAIVASSSKIDLSVEKIEKAISTAGDISRAATALGCSRRTLQLHMRKLGMAPARGGRRKHS